MAWRNFTCAPPTLSADSHNASPTLLPMCIVVFQWQPDSDAPLTLAANRDEFFARPTAAMHWWPGTNVLAGRDLQAGGTWFGFTRAGRFAFLTNVRDPSKRKSNAPTRGLIVSEFLQGELSPEVFVLTLRERAERYQGFNFVVGSLGTTLAKHELWFLNSNERTPRALTAGIYTLSNASLDTAWPKTEQLKRDFSRTMSTPPSIEPFDSEALQSILRNEVRASDSALPSTGVPVEWERALSSIFIRHDDYGTRASTTLHTQRNRVEVREVIHLHNQIAAYENRFDFELSH